MKLLIALYLLCVLTFWFGVAYVVLHFIAKVW